MLNLCFMFKCIYFICMSVYIHIHMYNMHVRCLQKSDEDAKPTSTEELELHIVLSNSVGAGDQTLVLCKSNNVVNTEPSL